MCVCDMLCHDCVDMYVPNCTFGSQSISLYNNSLLQTLHVLQECKSGEHPY